MDSRHAGGSSRATRAACDRKKSVGACLLRLGDALSSSPRTLQDRGGRQRDSKTRIARDLARAGCQYCLLHGRPGAYSPCVPSHRINHLADAKCGSSASTSALKTSRATRCRCQTCACLFQSVRPRASYRSMRKDAERRRDSGNSRPRPATVESLGPAFGSNIE
jgi:hypothetical protein